MSEFRLGTTKDGRVAVAAPIEILTMLQRIPGATMHYSPAGGYDKWLSAPASRLTALCVEAAGHPTTISESYLNLRADMMKPSPAKMSKWLSNRPELKRLLLQHQDDYCAYALDLLGDINASEQGTGKTLMSIALMGAWFQMHGLTRVLLLGPKSPLIQWENEIYETLPDDLLPLFVFLGDGDVPVLQRRQILRELRGVMSAEDRIVAAINYDVLADMHSEIVAFQPQLIIMDESWKIKTHNAQVTKAAIEICESLRRRNPSLRVLCLNGTPYTKDVGDLFPQVTVVTSKGQAGRYTDWMDDYSNQVSFDIPVSSKGRTFQKTIVKYSGMKDPAALMTRIAPVFWRATKDSCLDLPEKLPEIREHLSITPRVFNLYRSVRELGENALLPSADEWQHMDENLSDEASSDKLERLENISLAGAITKTLRLQQILSGYLPTKLTYDVEFNLQDIMGGDCDIVRKEDSGLPDDVFSFDTPKINWLQSYLRDVVIPNEDMRVIVWCAFNYDVYQTARLCGQMLGEEHVIRVVGGPKGIKDRDLEDAKKSFNSRDRNGIRIICAQTKRLAFGHNLQGGDHNVIFSHPWSYLLKDQLEDRTHRYGRKWPVGYTSLVSRHGNNLLIDDLILSTTDRHEDVASRLARDTTSLRKA